MMKSLWWRYVYGVVMYKHVVRLQKVVGVVFFVGDEYIRGRQP